MDRAKLSPLAVVLVAAVPGLALAAEEGAKQQQWWDVVGGILAIPAAILGLTYSYILIRKTRLEARKTELEIVEKEKALQKIAQDQPETARQIIAPIVEGRQTQYLILRFVLLYVVLQLWGLITSAFGIILGGAVLGVQQLKPLEFENL